MGMGRMKLSYQITGRLGASGSKLVAEAHCSHCGKLGEVGWKPGTPNNPERAQELFRQQGWEFDAFHRSGVVCPDCLGTKPRNDVDEVLKRRGLLNTGAAVVGLSSHVPAEAAAALLKSDAIMDAAKAGQSLGKVRACVILDKHQAREGVRLQTVFDEDALKAIGGVHVALAGSMATGLMVKSLTTAEFVKGARGSYTLSRSETDKPGSMRMAPAHEFIGAPVTHPTESVLVDIRRDVEGWLKVDPVDWHKVPERVALRRSDASPKPLVRARARRSRPPPGTVWVMVIVQDKERNINSVQITFPEDVGSHVYVGSALASGLGSTLASGLVIRPFAPQRGEPGAYAVKYQANNPPRVHIHMRYTGQPGRGPSDQAEVRFKKMSDPLCWYLEKLDIAALPDRTVVQHTRERKTMTSPPPTTQPRSLTPTQEAMIDKIMWREAYDEANHAWEDGWSDDRIAKQLLVPVASVVAYREKKFPIDRNKAVDALQRELAQGRQEVEDFVRAANNTALERLANVEAEVKRRIDALEARIAKRLGELR